jgi:plasmid stabilization system protein ParE
MKPYTVRYLAIAVDDVTEIQDFSKRFSKGFQKKVIDGIKEYCGSLAENLYRAPVYEHDARYRKAIVGDYVLFYQVDDKERLVSVFRILHGACNILSILKRNPSH